MELRECTCGSGEYPERQFDAQGIYLCLTCPKCEKERLSGFRPEVLSGYSQEDCDEPIDGEDGDLY